MFGYVTSSYNLYPNKGVASMAKNFLSTEATRLASVITLKASKEPLESKSSSSLSSVIEPDLRKIPCSFKELMFLVKYLSNCSRIVGIPNSLRV
jgi:hypothetical protein